MFIEPNTDKKKGLKKNSGWIEVICGSMFSGKTEELIRRLKRATIAKQKVEIFKPSVDTRSEDVESHNKNSIRSTSIQMASDMLLLANNSDVIGVDEAQFFDEELIDVCTTLANNGTRIIIAGLDMDFKGKPFGPMHTLTSIAEYVTKLNAICIQCGDIASYTFRLTNDEGKVMIGDTKTYEARCRSCFNEGLNFNL